MEPDANGQILDERYPARRVLNLIADKWTPIVMALPRRRHSPVWGNAAANPWSIQKDANSGAAQSGA